jgi:Uma2 family endonuclease
MDIMYAEILDGIEMKMSRPQYDHIRVAGNIFHYLFNQFRDKYIIVPEPNLYIGDNDLFFPDIAICREEILLNNGIYEPPELIMEVLSPSTQGKDKKYKFDKYFDFGVKEYWLIGPRDGIVDVYVDRKLWDTFGYVTADSYKVLSEDQREGVRTHVKSCVFPDLELKLEDVFFRADVR